MSRGGSRPGSGRKPVPSKAYTIRVPLEYVDCFEDCIKFIIDNTGVSKNVCLYNALHLGLLRHHINIK